MINRKELELRLAKAMEDVAEAGRAITEFDERIENNIFESIGIAVAQLTNTLRLQANDDCEGSYNCGAPEYTRDFVVDGRKYRGALAVEYNRYDKTYYYIDSCQFTYELIGDYVPSPVETRPPEFCQALLDL